MIRMSKALGRRFRDEGGWSRMASYLLSALRFGGRQASTRLVSIASGMTIAGRLVTEIGWRSSRSLWRSRSPKMARRILVVDDDELVLRAYVRTLREIPSTEIIQQSCSRRAAELLTSQSFDLLVSDVRMPEMNGVELLKIARRHAPNLPVILVAGFPDPVTVQEGLRNGASAFVTKPISPNRLLDTVYRVLKKAEPAERP